jgi:hypothetical protein
LFIHSSVDGHLDSFHFLTVLNNACLLFFGHVRVWGREIKLKAACMLGKHLPLSYIPNAAFDIGLQSIGLNPFYSLGYTPRSRITGSPATSMSNFMKKLPDFFTVACIMI